MKPRDKFAVRMLGNLKEKLAFHETRDKRPYARLRSGLRCFDTKLSDFVTSDMIIVDVNEDEDEVYVAIRHGNSMYGIYDSNENMDGIQKINKALRERFILMRKCAQRWKK